MVVPSLLVLTFTTRSIRVAARTMNPDLPWVMTPGILGDCLSTGVVGATLVFGVVGLINALRALSHATVAFTTLAVTSLVYSDSLVWWTSRPGQMIDLRVAATLTSAYVPQAIAILALATHALITARLRQPVKSSPP
jgi:hypothetical protein